MASESILVSSSPHGGTNGATSKPWQRRLNLLRSSSTVASAVQNRQERYSQQDGAVMPPATTVNQARKSKWWKIHLCKGIIGDIKRRAPYYWSDWTDAYTYRVIPSIVYMYFAKYDFD
jgi:boron transporter